MQSSLARPSAVRPVVAGLRARCAALAVGIALAVLLMPGIAVAATPAPYSATGDTRSGTTPAYVGQPIMAALFVVGLGIVVAGATMVIVRLGRGK